MTQEPIWLIGGPKPAEQVTLPQQAAPKVTKVKTTKVKVEGTYQGKTARQWRDLASISAARSTESFDRSDTNGALSQAGNNLTARKYRLCAQLAERDGLWEFPALFTLTGALVPDAVYIKIKSTGKWVWRIGRGEGANWFNESKALDGSRRRKNDAAKGFYVGLIQARGYVGTSGSAGMLSVGYFIGQVPESPVEIVDSGVGHMNLATQYEDR